MNQTSLRLRANGRNNSQHCCANNVGSCCVHVGSGVQTDATTQSQQCWDLQCIVGRIQPISLCKPCVISVCGPNNVGRAVQRIQHCCATLRRSRNKTNVGSCWLKNLTGFKLCATTSNNMQQGVQTDATCNMQQCWELLANNVASVCTGLHTTTKRTELNDPL